MSLDQLIQVAIVTVSDRCSNDEKLDLSGHYLETAFKSFKDKYVVAAKSIVPDEIDAIQVSRISRVDRMMFYIIMQCAMHNVHDMSVAYESSL